VKLIVRRFRFFIFQFVWKAIRGELTTRCRIAQGAMGLLAWAFSRELVARLHRIANKDEPVSHHPGDDAVLLLIHLNLAVDELTRAVKTLASK
jgi:hypothetical protein